jgi:hypothetical protein
LDTNALLEVLSLTGKEKLLSTFYTLTYKLEKQVETQSLESGWGEGKSTLVRDTQVRCRVALEMLPNW